jgi:hypothetical protein
MDSKVPTPVSGGGANKGNPDGVNESHARGGAGESGGGSYDNPHTGKDGNSDFGGFMGHGGQTDIAYHGSGQAGGNGAHTPNAATEGEATAKQGQSGSKPGPTGPNQDFSAEHPRELALGERKIEVIETSGVAAAEATGTTGLEGDVNGRNGLGDG